MNFEIKRVLIFLICSSSILIINEFYCSDHVDNTIQQPVMELKEVTIYSTNFSPRISLQLSFIENNIQGIECFKKLQSLLHLQEDVDIRLYRKRESIKDNDTISFDDFYNHLLIVIGGKYVLSELLYQNIQEENKLNPERLFSLDDIAILRKRKASREK